jgi:flagellar hook assembly protein FlgD
MVSFNVPATADVELRIYGADGGYVKTLASGAFAAGVHNVAWDGTNERGEKVSSGIYFAKFEYGEGSLTSKLILLR